MKKAEILAPVGSLDSLRAGIKGGCDAVYIGGSRFGARAFAHNPDGDGLLYAIDFAHLYGKRIYLTVNTLLKDSEMDELYMYLKPFYEAGLDGVIIQDIGVMEFVSYNFPLLPIHASTQMSLTMAAGAELLKPLGVTRFVPARELSLLELKRIRQETSLEIETFVHGALCFCYSGQCLLSSMIGGRSGNRGRCAQPCRTAYSLEFRGNKSSGYLLSPKDMCTLDLLGELVEAGVDSFKIEGRMKRMEYAGLTSYLYKKYTDLCLELGREGYERYLKDHKKEFDYDKLALMDLYNRGGFSHGYYKNPHGRAMMSMKRPNHFGVLAGRVVEVKKNQAKVLTLTDINCHDVLEFRNEGEEGLYDYTTGAGILKGSEYWARLKPSSHVKKGDLVYRTKNQELLQWLHDNILNQEQKIPVKGKFTLEIGKPLSLTLETAGACVTVEGQVCQTAQKSPVTKEQAAAAIDKLQDTLFCFERLEGQASGDVFVPVKALKELRRAGLSALEKELLAKFRREASEEKECLRAFKEVKNSSNSIAAGDSDGRDIHIQVSVWTKEQFKAAAGVEEVSRIYGETKGFLPKELKEMAQKAHEAGKEFYIAMPYIFRSSTFDGFQPYLLEEADGFLARNYEEAAYLKKRTNKPFVLDSGMYTFNRFAKEYWYKSGALEVTAPAEQNKKELLRRGVKEDILLVYGHIPLMVSAQCVLDNCRGCGKKEDVFFLADRKNKRYFGAAVCKYCYNVIYDGLPYSLLSEAEAVKSLSPKGIRLDFTVEKPEDTGLILKKFVDVFRYNKKEAGGKAVPLNSHSGHFRKGAE